MKKFEVGKVYKIIGHNGGIAHHFEIGDKVTLVSIAANGEGHLYDKKDGIVQFVSDCDVIKYRNPLKSVFYKIFNKKKKGE